MISYYFQELMMEPTLCVLASIIWWSHINFICLQERIWCDGNFGRDKELPIAYIWHDFELCLLWIKRWRRALKVAFYWWIGHELVLGESQEVNESFVKAQNGRRPRKRASIIVCHCFPAATGGALGREKGTKRASHCFAAATGQHVLSSLSIINTTQCHTAQ